MAGETQQQRGNGITAPVIPIQNQEPEIEIVEDSAAQAVQSPQEFPHDASDPDRAGSYEYDPEDQNAEQQTDARTGHAQQGVVDDQAAAGETPEQLTARQRRRAREKAARDRERSELIRLRAENARLVHGQQQLDARVSNVEQAGIDGQISTLESEIARANLVMKRAMEAQNADDFVQAQEIRDAFRDRLGKLKSAKEQATVQQRTEQAPPEQRLLPGGFTQAQVSYAQIFAGRHPWFNTNPGQRDQRSDMVRQLDNEMLAEGHNPSTPEYWVELERRVKDEVPQASQQAANGGDQQGGGQQPNRQGNNVRGNGANGRASGGPKLPGSGAGGSGAGGGSVKFHLSAARKQAMIDSGQWDDPERRTRQIKYFMKWDKEHPQS